MKKRIYLYKSGSLIRQDNSIVFIDTSNYKIYLPIYQIEIILIYGHCTFNKEVLKLLFENDITIILFSYSANYLGTFLPKHKRLGSLLLKQALLINDKNKCNIFKCEIIKTSIENMINLLKYYNKKGILLSDEISIIENNKNRIFNDYNNILIYEAQCKQCYYKCFNKIIKNKDFYFYKRSVRPPKDPINAILSYGYSILYGILETDNYLSDLEISLPFIHGLSRSKEGLQFDMADIFKPVLIDRLIIRLINKKQLTKDCFNINNEFVFLNSKGIKIFIEEFEILLNKTISVNNRKMSYRSLIKNEIYKLENSIKKETKFSGFIMKW